MNVMSVRGWAVNHAISTGVKMLLMCKLCYKCFLVDSHHLSLFTAVPDFMIPVTCL